MQSMHVNAMDLNLLRLFDAVYRQGSVSRASEELKLTQPAASQGLARLRLLLGDPLFIRAGGGVRPSPKAERLAEPVRQALSLLQAALGESVGFDPLTSRRSFRLHMSDIGGGRFLPDLMRVLARRAPGVRLETWPVPAADLPDALDSGRIDFAFGFLPKLAGTHVRHVELLQDRYCILLREGHPFLTPGRSPADTLAALRELEYVAVRSHADTLRILAWLQLEDRVRLTTEHFTVLPAIVRATNLAVVMPRAIALGFDMGYAVVDADLPHPDFSVDLHWSSRFEQDPAHAWALALIRETFGTGLKA